MIGDAEVLAGLLWMIAALLGLLVAIAGWGASRMIDLLADHGARIAAIEAGCTARHTRATGSTP